MKRLVVIALSVLLGLSAHDADAKPKKHPKKVAARTPPIAFYLSGYEKGATGEAAVAKCHAQRAKERQKHPELADYAGERSCEALLVPVRGPYAHAVTKGDGFDREGGIVYRDESGGWYDKNGEPACFVLGTSIATPTGDQAIESLRAGDLVWSWDVDAQRRVPGVIERTKRRTAARLITFTLPDGGSVTTTPNHPFFAAGARTWVEAGRLAAGDGLLRRDGETTVPTSITTVTEREDTGGETVIDLTVSPHHNYFAAGLLVHNY